MLKQFFYKELDRMVNMIFNQRNNIFPEKIKKILIIKGDHLGDAIISTIVLSPLKKNYPNSEIDVLCGSWSKIIYEKQNKINNIYILDHIFLNRKKGIFIKKFFKFIYETVKVIFYLKEKRYDLCLLLRGQENGNMVIIANLIHPKYIMGFETIKFGKLLDKKVMYDDLIMEKDNFLNMIWSIPSIKLKTNDKYEIIFSSRNEISEIITSNKTKVIMNYEGHDFNRKLSIKKMLVLFKEISRIEDIELYIINPPNSTDIEILKNDILTQKYKNIKILKEVTTILEILNYIKKCNILLSVDTSIIHLGSIFEKKIIGIYENERKAKKYSPNVKNKILINVENKNLDRVEINEIISAINRLK